MYSELLPQSNEKIFIEAIDQNFLNNSNSEQKIFNEKNQKDVSEFETNIEKFHVKFLENFINSDEETSIEDNSEENINKKKLLTINMFLNVNKESIEKMKNKVLNKYKNYMDIVKKVKDMINKSNNLLSNNN
jgi:hypothetical protein